MIKSASALGVTIINGDGGCEWQQTITTLTGQVGWLGLRVRGHLALSLYSSNEPGKLYLWPYHNDSTINIVTGVTIITWKMV